MHAEVWKNTGIGTQKTKQKFRYAFLRIIKKERAFSDIWFWLNNPACIILSRNFLWGGISASKIKLFILFFLLWVHSSTENSVLAMTFASCMKEGRKGKRKREGETGKLSLHFHDTEVMGSTSRWGKKKD